MSAQHNITADKAANVRMLGPFLHETPPRIEKVMDYYSRNYGRGWACFIRRSYTGCRMMHNSNALALPKSVLTFS